jgi:hypothetical protein
MARTIFGSRSRRMIRILPPWSLPFSPIGDPRHVRLWEYWVVAVGYADQCYRKSFLLN